MRMLARVCIALTSLLLFLPFPAVMPGADLDASFTLGINEAAAQRLTFGRDIIFTAGPFESIWSRTYHPGTFVMVLCGGVLLAIGHAFATFRIADHSRRS